MSQFGGPNPDTGALTTSINQWGQRRVYVMKSTDDGQTFTGMDGSSNPTDMTETLTPKTRDNGASWGWDAVGPGAGTYTSDRILVNPARGPVPEHLQQRPRCDLACSETCRKHKRGHHHRAQRWDPLPQRPSHHGGL